MWPRRIVVRSLMKSWYYGRSQGPAHQKKGKIGYHIIETPTVPTYILLPEQSCHLSTVSTCSSLGQHATNWFESGCIHVSVRNVEASTPQPQWPTAFVPGHQNECHEQTQLYAKERSWRR